MKILKDHKFNKPWQTKFLAFVISGPKYRSVSIKSMCYLTLALISWSFEDGLIWSKSTACKAHINSMPKMKAILS